MQSNDITERLTNLQTSLSNQMTYAQNGQLQGDPYAVTQLLPMLTDLAGIVQLLHVATDDMSDEIAPQMELLITVVEQLIKEEILPPEWQGALISALGPAMVGLEKVDDMDAYKTRFRPQMQKMEAWAKQQAQQQPQQPQQLPATTTAKTA